MTDVEKDTENEAGQHPDKAPRTWRFWLLVTLLLIVLLPLVLVAVLLLVLRSETGTAWVIDQIPGLNVEGDSGSLFGYWQADAVRWQGYGTGLELDGVVVDWSPGCLLSKELCLDTLYAERIDLQLQPSGDADEPREDISLPTVNLPVGVRIGDVRLGPFSVDGGKVWDRLEVKARGSGTDWVVERAEYRLDDIAVDVSGRLETRGDWPLDLTVDVSLPPPYGDEWLIGLNLTGSAQDLRLSGESRGYLNASVQGRGAPLDKRLPLKLDLKSASFLALDTLPSTLTLENWQLSMDGSLEKGFATRSRATLPGTEGPVDVSLQGQLSVAGASDVVLQLAGPEDGPQPGTLRLAGDINWAEALSAGLTVSLETFPWYSLLPDLEEPPVTLRSLNGDLQYQEGRYEAELEAAVSGPQGDADLETALAGDLESVSLTDLVVRTGAGSLRGTADIGFANQLNWKAALTLEDFNPGYWVPALEANLNGNVNSRGRLPDNGLPEMTAHWDISGNWQDEPAATSGELEASAGAWTLSDLIAELGQNRVSGNGRWGAELSGSFEVDLPEPGTIVTGLAGNLAASLTLTGGTLDAPEGQLSVRASDVAWQDELTVSLAELEADLTSGWNINAKATVEDLRSADQVLRNLELALTGDRDNHRLTVAAQHDQAEVALAFSGAVGEAWKSWLGAVDRGQIDLPGASQTWTLDKRAQLAYGEGGSLTLGGHCWRWQDSSVCADEQTLLPEPALAYQIANFPTSALAPLMPENLRWDASLDAQVALAMTEQGPDGTLSVDAGTGDFAVMVQQDEWETLRHDSFTVDVMMKPEMADVALALSGPELGRFGLDLSVDPGKEDRPVTGRFSLEGLDIALAGVVAGLEEVEGELNGEGELSGPLMKPAVKGDITLTDGRFVDPAIPLPLNDVEIALALNGYSADLQGRWRSNERSSGRLTGAFDWENAPSVEVTVSGERLPVTYDPYARVEVAPDITIAFREGELSVSGRVDVPRGEIEVRTLPEQAVSVSEDEVIVGAEPEESAVQALNMDVTVVVGDDQVTFDAFGVTGDLEGTLRIGNDMDTRGSLQLVDGQYEAYGQELELRRARIMFVGPLSEPYLDVEAIRRVDTVVAGIRLSGPVSEPETEVFSEPSMPQSDALSYVILGRSPQSRGEEGQMSQAALSLGLTQASKVTQGLGDELGIRNLTLEAEGSGDEASVVASGYVTDKLSLRYGVGIFEPITTVALRYDLGRYFYMEAASGLASSLDVFYTRDF
ncbi:translocation/assembly module TamB domain-containing protein [Marinobacter sp.]|uniref:translocation/assembly module TamB domain-containing protein n=1 Tax=Marinobacter sp. TaxID=50741 RepID=UPI0034A4F9FC